MKNKKSPKKPTKPKEERRTDFKVNDAAIEEAFTALFISKKRKPTWEEVAKEVGMSEKTVRNHFKGVDMDERMKEYRMGTGRVMSKLFIDASTTKDVAAKRLWFEVVEGLGKKKELTVTEIKSPEIITPGDEPTGH